MNHFNPQKNLLCILSIVLFFVLLLGDHIVWLFLPRNPNDNYTIMKESEKIEEEKKILVSRYEFKKDEVELILGHGHAKGRNTVMYFALKRKIDYLLFWDDDEYPITLSEVISKINSKETVYLFSGRSTCTPCKKFIPVLKEVQEETQIKIYYIDRNAIHSDSEGYQTFLNYSDELSLKFSSTPYFMIFLDGMYQRSVIGLQADLKDKLLLAIL